MLKKLLAFLCLAAAMTVTAQDRLGLLEIQEPKVKIGTYMEFMEYDGRVEDDYSWGTGYLVVGLETGKWHNISIGTELFAHGQLFTSENDALGIDYYDVDIEPKDRVSMSKLYLQYEQERLLVRAGRIGRVMDGRDVHLDKNSYEGAMAKFDLNDDFGFVAGIVTSLAEVDYDDAEDFNRIHNLNGGDASDALGFVEAFGTLAKIYEGNAFLYHHDDYASVLGLDSKVTLGDKMKFGGLLNVYTLDSKVAGESDSTNGEIGLFINTDLGEGNLHAQIGSSKFDGDGTDPALIKPRWFKDYMVHCDNTQWAHSNNLQDGMVNYIMATYKMKLAKMPCWATLYLGRTDYETAINDQHIELRELALGCEITKKLDFYLKFIDSEHKTRSFDYFRLETRLEYTF